MHRLLYDALHVPGRFTATTHPVLRPDDCLDHGVCAIREVVAVLGYQAAPAKLVDSTPTNELHMQRVGLLGITIRPAVRLASGLL